MPLGNLLETALSLLPPVTYEYRKYEGDETSSVGFTIPRYSEWIACRGMVQPVQSSEKQMFNLDLATRCVNVWGSIDLNTVDVQDHPDQVRFQGRVFNCTQCTDWLGYNGWHCFLCVEDKRQRESTPTAVKPVPNITPESERVDPVPLPPSGGSVKW